MFCKVPGIAKSTGTSQWGQGLESEPKGSIVGLVLIKLDLSRLAGFQDREENHRAFSF